MPETLTLRNVKKARPLAVDVSGRKWLQALTLALQGRQTLKDLAGKVKRSVPWLRGRSKVLCDENGGLEASLKRTHGGGKRSSIDPKVLEEMRKLFRPGDSPARAFSWLKKKHVKEIKIHQVYWLWQKWGFARKQTGRSRGRKLAVPRRDPLRVQIDRATMGKIQFLQSRLQERGQVRLTVLWLLGWRTQKLADGDSAASKAVTRTTIVENLRCSPQLLYKVARQWNEAHSDLNAFIASALSREAQKAIELIERKLIADPGTPQELASAGVTLGGIRFVNGRFESSD